MATIDLIFNQIMYNRCRGRIAFPLTSLQGPKRITGGENFAALTFGLLIIFEASLKMVIGMLQLPLKIGFIDREGMLSSRKFERVAGQNLVLRGVDDGDHAGGRRV